MAAAAPVEQPGLKRTPSDAPPFTLAQIRRAIPEHCWKRSLIKSSSYLLRDVVACALLFWGATWLDAQELPKVVKWPLWTLYWYFQGAFATGIWVIAHECGHGAFSESAWVNDAVGLVFHSLLLVPYYSWKHSHRRHHQNTGSVTRDEVFVPSVRTTKSPTPWLHQFGVYRFIRMFVMQTLGWPLYLFFNVSGRYYDRWANHFDPSSPIFKGSRERTEVVVSDVALAAVLSGLGWLWTTYGFMWLLKMYIIPYLIVNHWLVMITYLQHTHPGLPHYDDKEWNWLRGALATVDRSYGFLDSIFHHITDTHVVHHLFSQMPHYHAKEATLAIQKVIGPYYARDTREGALGIFAAMWSDFGKCEYVMPEKSGSGVLWYTH